MQDAELAGTGLARPVRTPGAGAVAAVQQPGHRGHQPVDARAAQLLVPHPVQLEHEQARRGLALPGRARPALPAAAPVGEPVEPPPVGLIVAHGEGGGGRRRHRGHHGGDDHRGLGGHLAPAVRDQAERDQQERAVEEEDEQPEHQRGHQQQGADEHRPDQRAQQAEGAGGPGGGQPDLRDAVAVVGLQPEVRQDPGQGEHREGGHGPHQEHPHQGTARGPPPSSPHAATSREPAPAFQARTARRARSGEGAGAQGCEANGSGRVGCPERRCQASGVRCRRSRRSAWTAGGAPRPSSPRCTGAPRPRPSPAVRRAARTRR